ncbi:hypothetical protein G9A89_014344 [Geosiphon pyriformis]|nr:hypothetical protein G9A89_014344 [Geosiphon pyriformis]
MDFLVLRGWEYRSSIEETMRALDNPAHSGEVRSTKLPDNFKNALNQIKYNFLGFVDGGISLRLLGRKKTF